MRNAVVGFGACRWAAADTEAVVAIAQFMSS